MVTCWTLDCLLRIVLRNIWGQIREHAVQWVVDNRAANELQVQSDLMGASGVWPALYQTNIPRRVIPKRTKYCCSMLPFWVTLSQCILLRKPSKGV